MSYQQKNITASLGSSVLILGFYLVRLLQLQLKGNIGSTEVFRLWGTVIILGIILTIGGNILTHILSSIIHAIRTNAEEAHIDDVEDERDKLIELRGTRVSYIAFSIGVLISMLTMVIGQPPLMMFTLLIFSGIMSQIIGDVSRLFLYRRGF